jgi:hypothetical protein
LAPIVTLAYGMALTSSDISSCQALSVFNRLNLLHYWTQISCGYLIHPDITVNAHIKIADIATETGYSLPLSVENGQVVLIVFRCQSKNMANFFVKEPASLRQFSLMGSI